jgi:misacylated tRNA(Ala) deacylase
VAHLVGSEAASRLSEGETIALQLDWSRRFKRMRVHTALHLLSVVLPYPVTGGSIGDGDGRLDFDIQDAGLDKAAITDQLNALVARDAPVTERWITDEELDANPGLVKTMSVKPPRGSGRVRLVEIEGIDLQPCGGTHVRRTGEIGSVVITDIEKKGKQNRRVRLSLAE